MLSDERLAEIEARHQPDPWMKEHRGLLWCQSENCHRAEGDEPVHVDWPCDVATLIAKVRRLRRQNHLLSLSRGTPSALVGLD